MYILPLLGSGDAEKLQFLSVALNYLIITSRIEKNLFPYNKLITLFLMKK